ncbi:lytic transglycosylase domain-containing protein [Acinetobacter sp. YH01016]|uniref:lytic transglycosylase domain-containing protein n=1 Tax=unclassified Acinetobacter TaxID=196816 RepID=UPI0015D35DDA
MLGLELIAACAPSVAPTTVQQIIQVESKGNPLALNVNGASLSRQPRDAADAAALARQYIAAGYTVDMGLMQVNSTNLPKLGYSVEDMFDTCKNLRAGAEVLTAFYKIARPRYADDQSALRAALSAYNTGSFTLGFANGYVAKYFGGAAAEPVRLTRTAAPNSSTGTVIEPPNPFTATTVVFIRQQEESTMKQETTQPVISRNEDDATVPGVQVEQTAEQAERNGAFEETAMSEADAWEANADLATDPNATGIVVSGKMVAAAKE